MNITQFCFVGKIFELGLAPCMLPPDMYYMFDADGWYTHIERVCPEDTAMYTDIKPPQFEPSKTRPKFDVKTCAWSVQPYTK